LIDFERWWYVKLFCRTIEIHKTYWTTFKRT
jgi:hypothetical protein